MTRLRWTKLPRRPSRLARLRAWLRAEDRWALAAYGLGVVGWVGFIVVWCVR